jgi:hypothetical protein
MTIVSFSLCILFSIGSAKIIIKKIIITSSVTCESEIKRRELLVIVFAKKIFGQFIQLGANKG